LFQGGPELHEVVVGDLHTETMTMSDYIETQTT
jgi:hypothetical protein